MLLREGPAYVWFCAMEHAEGLVKLIDWIESIRSMDEGMSPAHHSIVPLFMWRAYEARYPGRGEVRVDSRL